MRHIADFAEILIEFRIGISPGRPSEHSAQGREYLPELVVQLTGDVAQGGFLCRDQLLCQVAPLLGESRQPAKEFAVRADQQHAGKHNGRQRRDEERIRLSFHPPINIDHLLRGLLLALIVLDEQASDRDA